MKSKYWDKFTTEKRLMYCNNWCCPCNDGSTGCFANNRFSDLCDNSFYNDKDEFNQLLDMSYDYMVEGEDSYEAFCKLFYKTFGEGR